MVNEEVMDHLVDGIIDGLAGSGFGIGDGLTRESGGDDESSGEYELRLFYLDEEEFEHKIKITVTIDVEDIRDTNDEDDE